LETRGTPAGKEYAEKELTIAAGSHGPSYTDIAALLKRTVEADHSYGWLTIQIRSIPSGLAVVSDVWTVSSVH
jgi:hypothetical protein